MKRFPIALMLLVTVGFISFGDQVLPRSIGQYSTQARGAIDNMMVSAFPQWSPKANQYKRTNEAVQQMEKN